MKKLVLSFLFVLFPFLLFSNNEFLDQFELKRVSADFFGVTGENNIILAYGTAGIILRSDDKGASWQQIQLNDEYNIMDLIKFGYYYGVLNKNYVIKSFDDGKTWEIHKIGEYNFHRIKSYNNELYCLGEKKIIVLNTRLEKIKEYDIEIGDINGNPQESAGDQYDFVITDDKIFYVSDTLEITEIDLKNDKTRKLKLDSYGSIEDKFKKIPSNLFVFNDKLHFTLSTNLYTFENNILNMVHSMSTTNNIWLNYGNNLYCLYSIYFYYGNRDSIVFNKFDENYLPRKINGKIYEYYISNTKFTSARFLDERTVVGVGKDKLIYISYNGGNDWKLKSHLDKRSMGHIFRTSEDNAIFVGQYVKFVHTKDGGKTWLTQKNYNEYLTKDVRFRDVYNKGVSFFNSNFSFAYYFSIIKNDTNFVSFDKEKDTVRLINCNEVTGYILQGGINNNYNFFENNNTLFSYHNSYFFPKHKVFSVIHSYDNQFKAKEINKLDTIHFLLLDTFNDNKIYGLAMNYKDRLIDSNDNADFHISLSLLQSDDTAKSFKEIKEYEISDDRYYVNTFLIQNFSRSSSEIFFFHIYDTVNSRARFSIYGINVETGKMSKIGIVPDGFMPTYFGIQKINSKYYYQCIKFLPPPKRGYVLKLMENEDPFNNPDGWNDISPQKRYTPFSVIRNNDSLLYIKTYDSLAGTTVLFFGKVKKTTDIEIKPETLTNFYISEPMPNPASDIVKFNVYYNKTYSMEQADIKIYDIMGRVVSAADEFITDSRNEYSSMVRWNSSGVSPGVYFIGIRLGGETITKPLVIYR